MRVSGILLVVVMLFIGCENPGDLSQDFNTYQGRTVQTEPAPFLDTNGGMAKVTAGTLTISEDVTEGTVYGLDGDTTVYSAIGGEILSIGAWVDNQSEKPFEVSATSDLVITYEKVTTVTIIESLSIAYIDENGVTVPFTGSGVITTTEISTGSNGSVTLISSTKFGIGGDGGDNA